MPRVTLDHVESVRPLTAKAIEDSLAAVREEVNNQDTLARKGRFHGTHVMPSGPNAARLAVLSEEVGEVAHEVTEELMQPDESLFAARMYKELVQVAAVAVAWAAALRELR
jgi:hypothetical protein